MTNGTHMTRFKQILIIVAVVTAITIAVGCDDPRNPPPPIESATDHGETSSSVGSSESDCEDASSSDESSTTTDAETESTT